MASPFAKKDTIYGNRTLFRELGNYILRLEHYENSLKIFDEAIKNTPNDIRALVGRSKSRASASHYGGALEDINKALKLDPDNLKVLAQKALETYLSCEFEDGLVQNARLFPRRQKPEDFLLGIMCCSNAIESSIGDDAGTPLRDHFKIVRELAWKQNRMVLEGRTEQTKRRKPAPPFFVDDAAEMLPSIVNRKKKSDRKKSLMESRLTISDSLHSHKSRKNIVPPYLEELPFRPLQNYTSNIENFMAEKYLESMYRDKNFLKSFATQPGASCPNRKGTEKIKFLARRGYEMVAFKQELLRTRRPFYHIKYKEGRSTETLKQRKAEELFTQQQTTRKEAGLLLAKLQRASKENKFRDVMDIGEKLRKYCDSKPKTLLPNKESYLDFIFTTFRQSYYKLFRLNPNQYSWDQAKRIQMVLGLPISCEPSTDSVIDDIKPVLKNYDKQIKLVENQLRKPELGQDGVCWCYYEMCKANIEAKQYEVAKIYAKQCIQEAKISDNYEWMFITTMLLMRLHIEMRNKTDAQMELTNAKEIAERLGNTNLQNYLEKCTEVVESAECDPDTTTGVLAKREKNLLGVLDNVMLRGEFAHLLRQMSAMPASRRMPLVPGFRAPETAEKSSVIAKNKSIAPSDASPKEDKMEEAFQEKIARKKPEDLKGLGFMKLIQYHIEE